MSLVYPKYVMKKCTLAVLKHDSDTVNPVGILCYMSPSASLFSLDSTNLSPALIGS